MSKLISSVSPHFFTQRTTRFIMLDVIIALLPAAIASVWHFGWRSLLVIGVCVAGCVVSEFLFEKLCHRDNTVGDLSAIVTGLLLAYNLPVSIPLWQAVFGSVVAVIVVKQLFGGIGQNFANPAITARIVMMVAFSGSMTNWVYDGTLKMPDAVSSATPLAAAAKGTVSIRRCCCGPRSSWSPRGCGSTSDVRRWDRDAANAPSPCRRPRTYCARI